MSKDAVISGLLSLPVADQREVFDVLSASLGEVELSVEQLKEIDRRLDRIEREGPKGEPWERVFKELMARRSHARTDR
jgi:hypothetical protein